MAKKILITGVAGFAGRYLLEHLLMHSAGDALHGTYYSIDSLDSLSSLPATFHQADLTKKEEVERVIQSIMPDEIYHLAASSATGESFEDPGAILTNNILSQVYLLEAVRKLDLDTKVIVISSSDIYGAVSKDMLPLNENAPFMPSNPYAVSKIAQDYLALQYFISYGMRTVRVRPFNHIGPRQTDKFVVARFAKKIAEIEKGLCPPTIEVGNMETKRDFTDVRDIVVAYTILMEHGQDGDVYNVGSGTSYRIGEILEKLLSLSTKEIGIQENKELLRPSDTPELLCDYSKIREKFGWKPTISLEVTLKNTLDYWREIV